MSLLFHQAGTFAIGFATQLTDAANVSDGCFCRTISVAPGRKKEKDPSEFAKVIVELPRAE